MKKMGRGFTKVLLALSIPITFSMSYAQKITAEFYGAKLGTVIDAISQLSNKNIIWDSSASSKKDNQVYISIRTPVEINKLFKDILKENNLTYIKDGNVYKIKIADEYMFVVPSNIIKYLGKDVFSSVYLMIKENASSTATIKQNKDTYSIYVRDTKDNIKKLKELFQVYIQPLSKEAEKLAKLKEEREKERLKQQEISSKLIKKEIKVSIEDFNQVEDELIQSLSDIGKYRYDKDRQTLTIWELRENFQKISKILAKLQKVEVKTKCFYVRSLEPSELLIDIRENYLSKYGFVLFKSKEKEQIFSSSENQNNQDNQNNQNSNENQNGRFIQTDILTSLPKVCITDTPKVINMIKNKYSSILLDRPYQIVIEARIVQIESSFKRNLGIQWGAQKTGTLGNSASYNIGTGPNTGFMFDFPANGVAIGNGMSIGFSIFGLSERLDINLSALEEIGKTKILSRPKVITIDGEPAVISQGIEIPFQSASANLGTNVQFKEALLSLNVIPRTLPDGNVLLTINLTQDVPDFGNAVNGQPPIKTKTISSKVVAKDGSTIVIGGILEKTDEEKTNGVPGLHRIPLLGWMFKNKGINKINRELLIFISPKIIYE